MPVDDLNIFYGNWLGVKHFCIFIGVIIMTSLRQVVGMESSEKQQAQSLKLLLTIMTRCPEYARDFRSFGGHAMLSKVLASTACKLSCYILKVSLSLTLPSSDVIVDITCTTCNDACWC